MSGSNTAGPAQATPTVSSLSTPDPKKQIWDKFLGLIQRPHDTVKGWDKDIIRNVVLSQKDLTPLEHADVMDYWGTLQAHNNSPKGQSGMELRDDTTNAQRVNLHGVLATPWRIDRTELCNQIVENVNRSGLVLFRAPFASGKTSLAQLIQQNLRKSRLTAYLISLAGSNGKTWEQYWEKEFSMEWKEVTVAAQTSSVYVIVDEAQVGYDKARAIFDMWEIVKNAVNKNVLNFVFFGAYGDALGLLTTPIDFPNTFSFFPLDDKLGLAYTEQEYTALCDLFAKRGGFPIDSRSANYLFYITGGYPGIIGFILLAAFNHFHNDLDSGAAKFYSYLHSVKLMRSLQHESCRAIPDFEQQEDSVGDVCRLILAAESFQVPKLAFQEARIKAQLLLCLKVGIVVDNGDMISFAAPIVQFKALAHFFGNTAAKKPASLREFIKAVVQRFSPAQLANSQGRDTKFRLMEAQWQKEFYRAAAAVLPPNVFISPEYGRQQGVVGQVDFYIAEYKWMIEILREGIDVTGHEGRFEPGGRYEMLVDEDSSWVVIDFREEMKSVRRAPRGNTYHFRFSSDFETATLHNADGTTEVVPVLGDKVRAVREVDQPPGNTPGKLKIEKIEKIEKSENIQGI